LFVRSPSDCYCLDLDFELGQSQRTNLDDGVTLGAAD